MGIIKNMFSLLTIIVAINAISALFLQRSSETKTAVETRDKADKWTWKDTLWLVFMILSMCIIVGGAFFLSIHYQITVLWVLFIISHYLNMGSSIFPNMEIIGNIVKGEKSGELNYSESVAILTTAIIASYCNTYKIPDKIQIFANSLSNAILSDWILISFYVISIFICVFFCCALLINPLKMIVKISKNACRHVSFDKINEVFVRLGKYANSQINSEICSIKMLEYSFNQKNFQKFLLWLAIVPTLAYDFVKIILDFMLKLFASLIWQTLLIIKQIFNMVVKFITWLTSLKGRSVVAVSFRVAIILALSFSVIINKYQPYLRNYEESSSILEFISSSIIIPIIFEWILSYKKELKSDYIKKDKTEI